MDYELTDEEILEATQVETLNEDGTIVETGYLTGRKRVAQAQITKFKEYCESEEVKGEIAKSLCIYDAPYCSWDDIPEEGQPSEKDRRYYRRWATRILSLIFGKEVEKE